MGKDPPSSNDCENKHIDEWFDNPSIYNYNENKGIHEWYNIKLVIYNRSSRTIQEEQLKNQKSRC